ncbi:hypothetical protein R3P38DRAFT_2883871 [Favolaschia claudopus]|uniref:Secreted protein n=1 Tax=Favolaschia claudopus TaxID=2862362 RepID=A0AAW0CW55_9AGAR
MRCYRSYCTSMLPTLSLTSPAVIAGCIYAAGGGARGSCFPPSSSPSPPQSPTSLSSRPEFRPHPPRSFGSRMRLSGGAV